jgi:3-hydroxyisobutyrate dehydrogenase-like beta-hydroxyacid dehydrogenase
MVVSRSIMHFTSRGKLWVGLGNRAGELAQTIAHADETIRQSRAAQSERARVELEEARTIASAGEELCEAADILAVAQLVAAGYHRHKGQWRRRRRA